METYLDFDVVPFSEVALRTVLAAFFGLVIGIERDFKQKPIDFRAYMIVSTICCVVAIMSQELYADYLQADGTVRLDFMRVIEGVLTGIGFLGAGAIIRTQGEERVIGTATGASIWGAGGLGLMLGFGFYGLTVIAFLVVAGTLFLLGPVRAKLWKREADDHLKRE